MGSPVHVLQDQQHRCDRRATPSASATSQALPRSPPAPRARPQAPQLARATDRMDAVERREVARLNVKQPWVVRWWSRRTTSG